MKYKLEEILSLTLDIGEALIKSGAEVSRVEDTMRRIFNGYKVKYYEVYAINTLIIATLRDEKRSVTESRRIRYSGNNFYELEKLNELSRNICDKNVSRKKVLSKINGIKNKKNKLIISLGNFIAAFSFTIFFGGTFKDATVSSLISLVISFISFYLDSKSISKVIYNFVGSILIGLLAALFTKIFAGIHFDKIVIGDIMLLVPGLAMFTSIYDIFKGDTLSGTNRFVEGLFMTLSLAGGICLSIIIGGRL